MNKTVTGIVSSGNQQPQLTEAHVQLLAAGAEIRIYVVSDALSSNFTNPVEGPAT
jgi:hypothetical protein